MSTHSELTFDGKGINGPDQYRSRVATFTQSLPDADVKRYGALFANAPLLLTVLKSIEAWDTDASGGPSENNLDWDLFDALMIQAREVITKTEA